MKKTFGEEHIKFAQNVENNIRNLKILKISDGIVPTQKIKTIFESNSSNRPLLALPFILQLGKNVIEKKYCPFLLNLISLPVFGGMIGGRKKQAFYIFGKSDKISDSKQKCENSKLLYLDPHFVQNVMSPFFINL